MRVLILGGTGLISTAITRDLVARGDQVTTFNRGVTREGADPRVVQVRGDRSDLEALRAAWGSGQDVIIDMICFTADDAKVAIGAFAGLGAHYVFCSTVDVYTKPAAKLPIEESHERRPSPDFPYAHGKAECEAAFQAAHERGELTVTILRPAATYLDGAVPSVGSFDLALERLADGLPLILHGDGTSLWVACHRDDVARAFVAAAGNPAAYGNAYNITGTHAMTFRAYWDAVAAAVGAQPAYMFIPTAVLGELAPRFAAWCVQNFTYHNMFDCSAARRDLSFEVTIEWPQGIRAGLADRVGGTVDPAERKAYELIVSAWQDAVSRAAATLLLADL